MCCFEPPRPRFLSLFPSPEILDLEKHAPSIVASLLKIGKLVGTMLTRTQGQKCADAVVLADPNSSGRLLPLGGKDSFTSRSNNAYLLSAI